MAKADENARAESHDSGILWAYRFAPDGTAQRIEGERIDDILAQPDGWTWVHLALANHRCREWVTERAPLSAATQVESAWIEILCGVTGPTKGACRTQ